MTTLTNLFFNFRENMKIKKDMRRTVWCTLVRMVLVSLIATVDKKIRVFCCPACSGYNVSLRSTRSTFYDIIVLVALLLVTCIIFYHRFFYFLSGALQRKNFSSNLTNGLVHTSLFEICFRATSFIILSRSEIWFEFHFAARDLAFAAGACGKLADF